VFKRLVFFAAIPISLLAVWGGRSNAVTADTAAASVDLATAQVGEPVTFTSTNPCTVVCSLRWRRPDLGIARFGGVIVGRGEQITLTFPEVGNYQLVLDLAERCVGTSRLVCHSIDIVFVEVVAALPPDPVVLPPDPVVVPDPVVLPPDPVVLPPDPVVVPDPVVLPPDPVVLPPDSTEPLVAPSDLSVTKDSGRNHLTWTNPVSSATSLTLERCEGAGCDSFTPFVILDASTTNFTESESPHGSDFTYRLAASDSTTTVYSNTATEDE
jgi:hypothetical protein